MQWNIGHYYIKHKAYKYYLMSKKMQNTDTVVVCLTHYTLGTIKNRSLSEFACYPTVFIP